MCCVSLTNLQINGFSLTVHFQTTAHDHNLCSLSLPVLLYCTVYSSLESLKFLDFDGTSALLMCSSSLAIICRLLYTINKQTTNRFARQVSPWIRVFHKSTDVYMTKTVALLQRACFMSIYSMVLLPKNHETTNQCDASHNLFTSSHLFPEMVQNVPSTFRQGVLWLLTYSQVMNLVSFER